MITELSERTGARIAERRRRLGLSQAVLSERVEISQKGLARIEQGQQCRLDTLDGIRAELGCSFADLLDDE